jgi:hypothetical protein
MKAFFALALVGALAACGGNVFVDQSGSGAAGQGGSGQGGLSSTASQTPATTTTNPTSGTTITVGTNTTSTTQPGQTSTSTTSPVTTVGTTSGTTGPCLTCLDALEGALGHGVVCGSDAQTFTDLRNCGCQSNACLVACGSNFCAASGASPECQSCLSASCSQPYTTCTHGGAVVATSTSTGSMVTAVSSTGSGTSCLRCGTVIQGNGDPSQLCPSSEMLYENVGICACDGNCAMECTQACQGSDADAMCQACLLAPDPGGCSDEVNACLNDL